MKTLEQFTEELNTITEKLKNLQNEYANIYKQYEGNEFDNHMHCSSVIENLTLMLTHELASQIGFGILEFQQVINYINFRKKHFEYTDAELSKIIDKEDLSSPEKLDIINNKEEKDIDKIKSDWNGQFKHFSYKIFKEMSLRQ